MPTTTVEKIVSNAKTRFLANPSTPVSVAPTDLNHYPYPEKIVASLTEQLEPGHLFILAAENGAALRAPAMPCLAAHVAARRPGPNTRADRALFLFLPKELCALLLNDMIVLSQGYAHPFLPCAGRFFSRFCYCVCKKMAV